MPRSKIGIKRDKLCSDTLTAAVNDVNSGMSLRKAAAKYGVKKSTIAKYKNLYKEVDIDKNPLEILKNDVKKVFEPEEEVALSKYLTKAAHLHMGLGLKQIQELAYEFAVAKKKSNIPESWHKNKKAGIGWVRCYRERFPEFSLRKPEATSLARATSFNKTNVEIFFNNLEKVYKRFNFSPESIYNVDETGISTVHKPPRVLAPKNIRQLGKLTSAERGVNNTMIACINAIGNSVPPLIIFPRVYYKDNMLKGAPPGSIGAANKSGWSTEETFRMWLQHFINFVKPSQAHPILLTMDNHETHISIAIINMAKENGIILLTLPPHTSDNLQPLDRCVFGPFKTQYNKAADRWMLNHPGKPISIYDVAEIIGEAYPISFTPSNIIKSFEVSGICPFNKNKFTEEDFSCSYVTDRPDPTTLAKDTPYDNHNKEAVSAKNEEEEKITETLIVHAQVHRSEPGSPYVQSKNHTNKPKNVQVLPPANLDEIAVYEPNLTPQKNNTDKLTPESIRPFAKAAERKTVRCGRKPGKTRILTDTPEKRQIEIEEEKRREKKRKSNSKKTKIKTSKKKEWF